MMMNLLQSSAALALCLQAGALCLSAQTSTFSITNLGVLGGSSGGPSCAMGINAFGQVVGSSSVAGSTAMHPFLYTKGLMTDLGTLGGSYSTARAINALGQVVGYSSTSADPFHPRYHGFLHFRGTMTDLGASAPPLMPESYAQDINNLGQIVGTFGTWDSSPYVQHAFLYSAGQWTDLGTIGGDSSTADAINDVGQIVGASSISNIAPYGHAFLYWRGHMTDLGTLGGSASRAFGINIRGQIVGQAATAADAAYHAFLYWRERITDLGTLGGTSSVASGINDFGEIVGTSAIAGGAYHAFLYSDGRMMDLNSMIDADSGWTLEQALAINNLGQIVGCGYHNNQGLAFLLKPESRP